MSRAEQTRRRLQEQAIRLFDERGFDNVTVDQIAKAAGVSHMTFFRNFPTKESVVFDDPYDPVIAETVAAQPGDLPVLERVRRGILEAWSSLQPPDEETTLIRLRLAAGHPALRARVWENNLRTEDVIVEALARTGVGRLEARVASGAVNGALTAALFDWAEGEAAESLDDVIGRAMAVLGADHDSSIR